MDRLLDRFSGGFGMPSLRRMFDIEAAWRTDSSFSFAAPAIDVSEDDNSYKSTAELPVLEAKDLDLSISGDTLVIKGEKTAGKGAEGKELPCHRACLWLVPARLCTARGSGP